MTTCLLNLSLLLLDLLEPHNVLNLAFSFADLGLRGRSGRLGQGGNRGGKLKEANETLQIRRTQALRLNPKGSPTLSRSWRLAAVKEARAHYTPTLLGIRTLDQLVGDPKRRD